MAGRKRTGVYPHGKGWKFQVRDPRTGRWKQIAATRKRFEQLGILVKSCDQITKTEAALLKQRYEELLKLEVTAGIPAREQLLSHAIEEYLRYQRNVPRFLHDKERVLGEFVKVLGNLPLRDVEKAHLREFENRLRSPNRERELHNNSVARYLRYVRTFFNYCHREGWIYRSPFRNFPIPQDDPTEIRPLTLDEVGTIVRTLKAGKRDYAVWMVAGFVGLGIRSIELQGLDWNDFDEEHRFVRISKSKNLESRRLQPVPLSIFTLFNDLQQEHGPMFPTMTGERASRNQMSSLGRRIATKFPGFNFGLLRKTYSTLLHNARVDSLIVDRLLGHSSLSSAIPISARHYIGREYEHYRALVDQALKPLGEVFSG